MVTRWGVPPDRQHLILRGTPQETKKEAEQYFSDEDKLIGFKTTMREDDFEALPEFEG